MRLPITACILSIYLVCHMSISAAPDHRAYIGYVYPAGGQQGTTVDVKLGGEYVYGATAVLVSGAGVTAEVIDSRDPSEGKDQDGKKQKKRKNQAVIDEIVKVKVTIAPDAAPGDREIRLLTPEGPSTPLMFQVGQLKEVCEVEPDDKPSKAVQIDLPVAANGQISAGGDVDMFKFTAQKGQCLVMEVAARKLIPYLADAVPGWFQATLTLYDAQNREVAFVDDYRFDPDPVMFYEVPTNGEYRLAIRDSISRGRADFVYRIKIGELPFITSLFPLGAQRGTKPFTVKVTGKNLQCYSASVAVDRPGPCLESVTVTSGGLVSTPVKFAVGTLPEVMEDEAATRKTDGQLLALPALVNGRIGVQGEKDFYRFEGRKGDRICLEVHARRLGSPLDSCLIVSNQRGERLWDSDDVKDRAEGLLTHQSDSELLCELPEDGVYVVRLFDSGGKGGDEYAYRLGVGPPAADFDLRATPSSLGIARGGSARLTVHAIRRFGFAGDIRLGLDAASAPGFRLDGTGIVEGTNVACLTISAPEEAEAAIVRPRLIGTAEVDGRTVSRPVVPAEDMMQAFIYRHLVPAKECVMAVAGSNVPFRVVADMGSNDCVSLPQGKEMSFKVKVFRTPGFAESIRLQLEDPPKGITLRKAAIPAGKDSASVTVRTESSVAIGLRGNLILTGIMMIEKKDPVPTNGVTTHAAFTMTTNEVQTASSGMTNSVTLLAASAGGTNAGPSGVTNVVSQVKKDKVSVLLPALPFRVVKNPGK